MLDRGSAYCLKRLRVEPGQRISLQRHLGRSERWTVVAGRGLAWVDGVEHRLDIGDALQIPRGSTHRLACAGDEPLVVIEVQLGSRLDEDDIERFEDDYGRV